MSYFKHVSLLSAQRGVLAVTTPMLVLLIIFLTVLLLDGARLYAVKRQMQSIVNGAAIAAAGEAQACYGAVSSILDVRNVARHTAIANGWDGEGDFVAAVGAMEFQDSTEEWRFRPVNYVDESNAVGVSYTRNERVSLLLPKGAFGDVQIHVTAVGRREIVGSFSLSSSTAVIGASNSVLGTILPQIIPGLDPVDVTSLESLRNVTGSLQELLVALRLDSVEDLLPLSATELAEGLSAVGGITAPAMNVLDGVLVNSGIDTVKLTDVLKIVEASSVPPDTEFPLYDTVISLVLNVAQGVLFEFPNTSLSIPNLLELDLSLVINDAPSVLIGPARKNVEGVWIASANGADISLDLDLKVGLPSVMGISLASIDLPISVRTGTSRAELVGAFCAKGVSNNIEFDIDASFSGVSVDGSIAATVIDLSIPLPLLPPIQLRVGLSGDVVANVSSGTNERVVFPAVLVSSPLDKTPQNGYRTPVTLGDNGQGLELEVSNLEADLKAVVDLSLLGFGGLLGAVEGVVNSVLGPLLDSLVSQLITPLLSGLGVDLGVVTLSLVDARQSSPVLIENIALPEM